MRAGVGFVCAVGVLASCGGSGSSGADASVGSGTDADLSQCAPDPAPPGLASCPAVCTGGCSAGNVCNIDCPAAQCNDTTITCPPEYACNIVCTGTDGCDSSTIVCPTMYACSISCDGIDACGDIELGCGEASCAIECGPNPSSCTGAVVTCGAGACTGSCGAGVDRPALSCGTSCGCGGC